MNEPDDKVLKLVREIWIKEMLNALEE